MSSHISHNDPKQPCKCATPAVSKHNITPKDLEHGGGCGCHQQDLNPSRLDQVIAQYEAMTKEAEAARDEFLQKAKDLEDIAKETKATENKTAIIEAVNNAQPDLSLLAKEAQATLNKQEVIQKISKFLGLPCVEVVHPEDEYKTVFIRNISVNLLKRCIVQAGVLGVNDRIKFRIAHIDGDAMLYTTSDSYAPLANTYLGNYDDGDIIDEISFGIDTPCDPSVYIDGIKLNGLFDNVWRLSQIQNTLIGVDTGIVEVKQAIQAVMGDITPFNTGKSIPACYFDDQPWDIDSEETIMEQSQMTMPDNFGVRSVVTAGDFDSEIFYVASKVGTLSISYDGQDYIVSGVTEWLKVAANKAYRCVDVKTVTFEDRFGDIITGYIYVYEEYDPTGKSIKQVYEKLNQISPEDPYSQALAAFFNITPPVPNAVPMTQQEVEDDLDELWNLIITQ